ncbi:hypothetical protein FQ087_16405 [Sporosarcina sp. ANT_H38]|uniref:hypothetical protein n=1 Tax=Sporosarcina sp. ANT_H38 TaxID=2597358 RepID=UPI0011F251C6|nr:hypothetical protein [Sporosarcina sp. ANT_H38]KAA0948579.1 hypothetical protein FQ087_16405 [Sporosarcina sp. ANT_H38]
MRNKYMIITIICCALFLNLLVLPKQLSLVSVFRVTEKPAVIVRGSNGSALTVNISFGDVEVEQWIRELSKPFPLLLVDMKWAERFPETVQLIKEKNIPVGLLGDKGITYEQNTPLFIEQLEQFEKTFEIKPLWFRTVDEVFPITLHSMLWEAEINALGSSVVWHGGELPTITKGEIISVPHHRENRVNLAGLNRLYKDRTFISVEDMLFGTTVKVKKIPE